MLLSKASQQKDLHQVCRSTHVSHSPWAWASPADKLFDWHVPELTSWRMTKPGEMSLLPPLGDSHLDGQIRVFRLPPGSVVLWKHCSDCIWLLLESTWLCLAHQVKPRLLNPNSKAPRSESSCHFRLAFYPSSAVPLLCTQWTSQAYTAWPFKPLYLCPCSSLLGMSFYSSLAPFNSLVSWGLSGIFQDPSLSHTSLLTPEVSLMCPPTISSYIRWIYLLPPLSCEPWGQRVCVLADCRIAPPSPIPPILQQNEIWESDSMSRDGHLLVQAVVVTASSLVTIGRKPRANLISAWPWHGPGEGCWFRGKHKSLSNKEEDRIFTCRVGRASLSLSPLPPPSPPPSSSLSPSLPLPLSSTQIGHEWGKALAQWLPDHEENQPQRVRSFMDARRQRWEKPHPPRHRENSWSSKRGFLILPAMHFLTMWTSLGWVVHRS